jgi:translation initiation factor 2 beta subunit (eIF-2beta)/eIF-5
MPKHKKRGGNGNQREQSSSVAPRPAVAIAAAAPRISLCQHLAAEDYQPKAVATSQATVPINQNHPGAGRYRMPPLLAGAAAGKQNGSRTVLYNLSKVALAVQRAPELLSTFFSHALSMPVRCLGAHAWMLGGPASPDVLDRLLQGFIADWVLCPACGLPECGLSVLPVEAGGGGGGGGESEHVSDRTSGKGKKGKQRGKQKTDGATACKIVTDHGERKRAVWCTCSACAYHGTLNEAVATRQPKLVKLLLARPDELGTYSATVLNRSVAAGATGARVSEATALAESTRSRHLGSATVLQLRTTGAFTSHCRQLGRLLAIDTRAVAVGGDARAQAVQLSFTAELLVQIFVWLDPESLYRCMQSCVGWNCQGRLAIADQRLLRHAAPKLGGGDDDYDSDSSSDQSFTTSDSSDDENS